MKAKGDKKNLSVDKDIDFPDSDLDDNLEFVLSEYEEDNFYGFIGEDNNESDRDKLG